MKAIDYSKLCFLYCGDDVCDCGASPHATPVDGEGVFTYGGKYITQKQVDEAMDEFARITKERWNTVNIGSKSGYPSSALSNFSPHPFTFEGVEINSMEGFLQSLKFDKEHIQVEVCKLIGMAAKRRGAKKKWQTDQTLYWKGNPIHRHSEAYQRLLDYAYKAMFDQSDSFRRALAATGNATLTHTIGRTNASETVLTQREFCSRLESLRNLL